MHPITAIRLAQIQHEERLAEAAHRRRVAQARARRKQSSAAVTGAEQVHYRCPDCEQPHCICRAGPPLAAAEGPQQELATTSV